jgi:hypothetical protein
MRTSECTKRAGARLSALRSAWVRSLWGRSNKPPATGASLLLSTTKRAEVRVSSLPVQRNGNSRKRFPLNCFFGLH